MTGLLELGDGAVIAERYRIVRPLSRGGMGAVYVAEQLATKKLRALKIMLPELVGDPKLRSRFVQEAQIGAAIESEHVVEVIDAGVDAERGIPWIAMELLQGETLADLVAREGSLGAGVVRDVLEQLCHALAAAHDKRVVHRDLKPENVFLATSRRVGVPFTVKVLDFGIAKLVSEAHTRITGAIGTPLYMAPEQMVPGALVAAPTDIWAMGLVAFQLLTGRSYWLAASADGSSGTMLMNEIATLPLEAASVRAATWEIADRVPEGFDAWFARSVCREMGDRWADARAAWKAIATVLGTAPRGHYPSIAPPVSRTPAGARVAESADESTEAWLERKSSDVSAEAPTELPERSDSKPIEKKERLDSSGSTGAVRPTSQRIAPQPNDEAPKTVRSSRIFIGAGLIAMVVAAGAFLFHRGASAPSGAALPSATPSASAAAAAPLPIHGFACSPATLEGEGQSPELASAIGVGACARLAVEMGVDWNDKNGEPVAVHATLKEKEADVELRIADRSARATGPTPMDALVGAVAALSPSLTAPPLDDEAVRAWGAKDAASARRIKRAWRRLLLNLSPDDDADARALVADDPGSAWAYTLVAALEIRGTQIHEDAVPKALALLDKLPPARAKALKGTLDFIHSPAEQKEGFELIRKAYIEAPDDVDIAGLYASIAFSESADDEGIGVTDRLYERAPTNSVLALLNAQKPETAHDLVRDQKYIDRLVRLFPESIAWPTSIEHLALQGKFDEAHKAIRFGEQLGMTSTRTSSANLALSRAQVEMMEHHTGAARDLARELVALPRSSMSADAAEIIINSYMLEGRVIDGESAFLREIDRQRSSVSTMVGMSLVGDLARSHRWLGEKPPSDELLDWAEKAMKGSRLFTPGGEVIMRVDIALARAAKSPEHAKDIAEKALAEAEQIAEDLSDGQRIMLDSMLVQTVPLVRVARGDKAAAARWRETDRAYYGRRRITALDAGLALEAAGDKDGAREAYRLSQDGVLLHEEGLATLAAMIKEAALDDATGHKDEAKKLKDEIDRLMQNADKGVREKLEALK